MASFEPTQLFSAHAATSPASAPACEIGGKTGAQQAIELETGRIVVGGVDSHPMVLDPCCGSRMWWFDKTDPRVLFGDQRRETITVTDRSHGNASGTRTLNIDPDVLHDFRALPYADESFHLVAFDPPHLVRAGKRSWLAAKYGKLGEDWRDDLRAGFSECFRILKPHGVLVFKWNETQVKVREVLALTPQQPLFGHTSVRRTAGTHWIVFINAVGGVAK